MCGPVSVLQFASTIKSRISPDLEKGECVPMYEWIRLLLYEPGNVSKYSLRYFFMIPTVLSLNVRRRGGGRGEWWWDQRLGAAVQFSWLCGWGEGSDGSTCQTAPDESEPAVRATSVTHLYNRHFTRPLSFNLSAVSLWQPVCVFICFAWEIGRSLY